MKKSMKFGIYTALTLAFVAFAGCSSSRKEEAPTETPAVVSEEPAPMANDTVAQNDTLNLGASSAGRAH